MSEATSDGSIVAPFQRQQSPPKRWTKWVKSACCIGLPGRPDCHVTTLRDVPCAAAAIAAVLLVWCANPLSAQGVEADLSGTIRDATGGAVGGASVRVVSIETGLVRAVKADELGRYRVPVLPSGDYRVEVEAAQFGKATRKIRLMVGQTAILDFELP